MFLLVFLPSPCVATNSNDIQCLFYDNGGGGPLHHYICAVFFKYPIGIFFIVSW